MDPRLPRLSALLAFALLAGVARASQELAPPPPPQEPAASQQGEPAAPSAPAYQGTELQVPVRTFGEPGSAGGPVRVLNLTLDQAVDLALQGDLALQIQELQVDVQRFEYVGSWGAFDPVTFAGLGVTDTEIEARNQLIGAQVLEEDTIDFNAGILFPLTTGGSFEATFARANTETNSQFQLINPSTTDTLGLTFRQPLLRNAWSGYATSLQDIAELEYQRTLEDLRSTRQDLIQRVDIAYWDLVAAIGQLEVSDATLSLGQEQQQQNTRRLEAGVGTQVEVLQAETNVAQQVQQRLLREVAVREAADRLKAVIYPGIDPIAWNTQIVPVTPLPEATTEMAPPWEVALLVALDQRPLLRQQRLVIETSEVLVDRAISERRPQLDLLLSSRATGFDGDPQDAFESAGTFEFPQNTASVAFSYPLLNRTAANAERAARAQLRAERLRYDQLESQIAAEVRAAVRQLLYQAEAVRAARKSQELAARQLEADQARYREGLSTNFQVLEFQEQLSVAQFSLTRARAEFAKAATALLYAQGLLGEVER